MCAGCRDGVLVDDTKGVDAMACGLEHGLWPRARPMALSTAYRLTSVAGVSAAKMDAFEEGMIMRGAIRRFGPSYAPRPFIH